MVNIQNYIQEHKQQFLEELFKLLKLPSISADPSYKPQLMQTAEEVANALKTAGCSQVNIMPTAGNPVVYAEKIIDNSLPTVLVYGHYDVQPADPIELWDLSLIHI